MGPIQIAFSFDALKLATESPVPGQIEGEDALPAATVPTLNMAPCLSIRPQSTQCSSVYRDALDDLGLVVSLSGAAIRLSRAAIGPQNGAATFDTTVVQAERRLEPGERRE